MRPFERALRLLLDLHAATEAGKGESPEADRIREELDSSYGWCSQDFQPENRLSEAERKLLEEVSGALHGDPAQVRPSRA